MLVAAAPPPPLGVAVGAVQGGLRKHVDVVNAKCTLRVFLEMLEALHINNWPDRVEVTGDPNIFFLKDDNVFNRFGIVRLLLLLSVKRRQTNNNDGNNNNKDPIGPGGTVIPPSLFNSLVCLGGTFDGMHYSHQKLLTLAVSSV